MSNTIRLHKAQHTIKGDRVTGVHIEIKGELPATGKHVDTESMFKQDALALADGLFSCLPGGTLDALLVEMLQRKQNQMVVVY